MKYLIKLRPLLPLLIIGAALFVFYCIGGFSYLNGETLRKMHNDLLVFCCEHRLMALGLFFLGYVLFSLTLLPGVMVLDLLAGYFFLQPYSTFLIALGCTTVGTILFLSVRFGFQGWLPKSNNRFVTKVQESFQQYQTNYLLFLRVMPLCPPRLAHIALAFVPIRFSTFLWTTFIGTLPIAYLLAEAGRGLGTVLEAGGPITFASFITPTIMISLALLAMLTLLPLFLTFRRK